MNKPSRSKKRDFSQGPVWDPKRKVWVTDIQYPDREKRARHQFRRKKNAIKLWVQEKRRIEDGTWQRGDESRLTVGEAADRYATYAKAHHRSFKSHTQFGIRLLRRIGEHRRLSTVTKSDIDDVQLARLGDGVCMKTVDNELSVVKSAFSWAAERRFIYASPAKKVKLFRESSERIRYLSEADEYPRLIASAREGPWYLASVIVVACHTDLRRRNILSLEWSRVEFQADVIVIEARQAKGKRIITIQMNQTVINELRAMWKISADYRYVFPHLVGRWKGEPIGDIKNSFADARKRAGIEDFRFHDCRHTFCSWLALRGVPLRTIKELAGHASINTTLRYAHLSKEHVGDAVSILDRIRAA